MNNPFLPISFKPGPPTTPTWEDGPTKYGPQYNGHDQVSLINAANPISPTNNPGWCVLPGAAQGYSKIP
jgi:hypothetical protein